MCRPRRIATTVRVYTEQEVEAPPRACSDGKEIKIRVEYRFAITTLFQSVRNGIRDMLATHMLHTPILQNPRLRRNLWEHGQESS